MNSFLSEHSACRLTYALDSTGKLVHIDKIPTGKECACFCPACKEPLLAKNQGSKRMHHFAHLSGTDCHYAFESMLHLLAKEKIYKSFLSNEQFWIKFKYKSFCSKFKDCNFVRNRSDCCKIELKPIDLKQWNYDTCEQEKAYDNINRRSDLKIFSSTHPENPPIYLEFYVTHKSDMEKLHSNNKIIEIHIESEDDILQIVENGICESVGCDNNEYDIGSRKVRFYNFKEDYKNNSISAEIRFFRYILYPTGKTFCGLEYGNCKKLTKSKRSSLLEICVHAGIQDVCDEVRYIGFQKFGIPNCMLCKYYVNKYNGDGKICYLYNSLKIQLDNFDTARARNCSRFEVRQQSVLDVPYTILDK